MVHVKPFLLFLISFFDLGPRSLPFLFQIGHKRSFGTEYRKTFPLIVFSRWPFPAVAGAAWSVTMMLRWVCLNFVFFEIFWELSIKISCLFQFFAKNMFLKVVNWVHQLKTIRQFFSMLPEKVWWFKIDALYIEFCPQRLKSVGKGSLCPKFI